jgi:two-component system chemotaxis response regulator CheB
VCAIIKRGLQAAEGIEVIGIAPDPYVARDMIVKNPPDVVTLDIEMPRMDGLTFMGKLMKHFPLPVVICSSLTQEGSSKALEALSLGAVEVIAKNVTEDRRQAFMIEIVGKVRSAARARVVQRPAPAVAGRAQVSTPSGPLAPLRAPAQRVLAIGASTGGTEALARIFERLPANTPPTVVVQHMPPVFTRQLAARLDRLGGMTVVESAGEEELLPGHAYIAPGDHHLELRPSARGARTHLSDGPPVNFCRPAVDILFRSAVKVFGGDLLAVVLTGMGADGRTGCEAVLGAGGTVMVQDEASSVVWGMPGAVAMAGFAHRILPLDQVGATLVGAVNKSALDPTGGTR